jgi:hypothetical protein
MSTQKFFLYWILILVIGLIVGAISFLTSCTNIPSTPSATPSTKTDAIISSANSATAKQPALTMPLPTTSPNITNPANDRTSTSLAVSLHGAEETQNVATQASAQLLLNLNTATNELGFKLTTARLLKITMAQLQLATRGQNGPPVVPLYPLTGSQQTISGIFNGVLSEGIITKDDFIGLLENQPFAALVEKLLAGVIYANIQTEQNPYGEIRGQIIYPQEKTAYAPLYTEIFGTINKLNGSTLTIQKTNDSLLSFTRTPDTWIQLADGTRGSGADLKVGDKIKTFVTLDSSQIYKVELRDENNICDGFITGKIVSDGAISLMDAFGRQYILKLTDHSLIYDADGTRGGVGSLKQGTTVQTYYNSATREVFKVEIN